MDTVVPVPHSAGSAEHHHLPSPDVIARGWLTDLVKLCREEIRATKRRVTQYEVWERVQTRVEDDPITDDGEPVTLSSEMDAKTRTAARRIAERAASATEIGLAVRL